MLSLRNVHVTFNRGTALAVPALQGIDLDVPAGQFVTLIGTNGAGKSTLLSVVAGDVRPERGTVMVEGKDLTPLPSRARAGIIGRVFQDPRIGTCASLSVEENLALALSRGRRRSLRNALGDSKRRALLAEQLERLGLGLQDRLTAPVGTLSGGQRQAVSLLMATLPPMKVLILDEHTAALDPGAAARVLQLSAEINQEQSLTTLMVTHSMRQALDYGDRTIMMTAGRIALDVTGTERAGYDVGTLMELFKRTTGEPVEDDQLVLS